MPGNITEYTASLADRGVEPSNLGTQALAQAGRRIGVFFNQTAADAARTKLLEGQAIESGLKAAGGVLKTGEDILKNNEDIVTARQINLGGSAQADMHAKLEGELGTLLNDPESLNDPNIGSKFRDSILLPELQKFRNNFTTEGGQKWATTTTNKIYSDFVVNRIPHAVGQLTRQAFDENYTRRINVNGQTLQGNPMLLDHMLDLETPTATSEVAALPVSTSVNKSVLLSKHLAASNEAYVIAAIHGWALKGSTPGPEGLTGIGEARKIVADPKYRSYLSNPEQVEKGIGAIEKFQQADAAHLKEIADQELEKKRAEFTDTTALDPTKTTAEYFTSDLYKNDSAARNRDIKIFNQTRKFLAGTATISPAVEHPVLDALRARINAPDDDPNKIRTPAEIDAALADGKISLASRNALRTELKSANLPLQKQLSALRVENFKNFAPVIGDSLGGRGLHTAADNAAMARAQDDLRAREAVMIREGKDPTNLYRPGSPDNFFTLQNLMGYRSDLTARLRATNNVSGHSWSTPDIGRAAQVISAHLEGAGYQSVGRPTGKGDVALGKYQVMQSNVASWTKEALGHGLTPQQFLADPAAQDAVFDKRFGDYLAKYGPNGAARAWYGGEGGMNNLDMTDINRRITVGDYGRKFASIFGARNYDVRNTMPREIPPGTTFEFVLSHPDLYPTGSTIRVDGVNRRVVR